MLDHGGDISSYCSPIGVVCIGQICKSSCIVAALNDEILDANIGLVPVMMAIAVSDSFYDTGAGKLNMEPLGTNVTIFSYPAI
jgi:hypothetical protein